MSKGSATEVGIDSGDTKAVRRFDKGRAGRKTNHKDRLEQSASISSGNPSLFQRAGSGGEAEEVETEHVAFDGVGVGAGGPDDEVVLSFFQGHFAERELAGVGDASGLVKVDRFPDGLSIESEGMDPVIDGFCGG